jgi:hypothetical protein
VIEKNKSNAPVKYEILNREVKELKESLRDREIEVDDLTNSYCLRISKQEESINRLEGENHSLIRLLKEKEDSLASSTLSIPTKSADKDRLSLVKIKEQHHQNLKLMQENVCRDIYELQNTYEYQFE